MNDFADLAAKEEGMSDATFGGRLSCCLHAQDQIHFAPGQERSGCILCDCQREGTALMDIPPYTHSGGTVGMHDYDPRHAAACPTCLREMHDARRHSRHEGPPITLEEALATKGYPVVKCGHCSDIDTQATADAILAEHAELARGREVLGSVRAVLELEGAAIHRGYCTSVGNVPTNWRTCPSVEHANINAALTSI